MKRLTRVMLICALIVFLDGYDLQALSLAIPSLAQAWSLRPDAFAWALSSSLIGLGLGSAFIAPLGDRLGRRPLLIAGLILVGVGTLAIAWATALSELIVWRLVTGLGLGVCQANATALTSEFAPLQKRAGLITLMGCNVAVGALIAGLLAPLLLGRGDWPAIFIVGGIAPLLLALLVWRALPESPTLLQRVAKPAGSVLLLLRAPYLQRTLCYWLLYGLAAMLLYLLVSWLPAFLVSAGWQRNAAVRGIAVLQLGGIVGALLLARLIDKRQTLVALCAAYLLAAIIAPLFLVASPTGGLWWLLLLFLGAAIAGGMFAVMSLGGLFYPDELRATGFGWAAAVARVGAVLGPLLGGKVLAAGVSATHIIAWIAVPALICVLAALSARSALSADAMNANVN
jgi:MFS transporter, AAHS family, 4-hydroxybenzoate transporter